MKYIFYTILFYLITIDQALGAPSRDPVPLEPGPSRDPNIPDPVINNPLKGEVNNIYDLVQIILEKIVFPIGAVVAVMFIVYSGFKFVTAQGNPDKIKEARNTFMWSVIGTLILLGAWVIATIIQGTVNELTGAVS